MAFRDGVDERAEEGPCSGRWRGQKDFDLLFLSSRGFSFMKALRLLIVGLALLIPSLAVAQQAPAAASPDALPALSSRWVGSAFAGAVFGQEADGASLTFGGSLGYLWRGMLGADFLADFTPNFALDPSRTALLFGPRPWFNSYMFNMIGAAPLGARGQFQPYLSAGLGALRVPRRSASAP